MLKAKESPQVERARKKIQQKLTEETQKITPEAIKNASNVIRSWIERHNDVRVSLKNKVGFFDQNQSSATVKSKFVIHKMQQLQKTPKVGRQPSKALGGRVKMD